MNKAFCFSCYIVIKQRGHMSKTQVGETDTQLLTFFK